MTIFVEVLDLFNDSNEVNFFMTTLNEEINKLFNLKFNVFFNINFLNWFESCVNNVNRFNELTNLIKIKFKIERKSNEFFKKNMNALKISKWLQQLNSKIKQSDCMFNKILWTFI